jgi:hypothetical protein
MRYGPWPRRGRLLRHLSFSSSFPRVPNPGGSGHVKGALAHLAQRGLPLTWPRRDYIALLEEEEKRRSNRQRCFSAARGRAQLLVPRRQGGRSGEGARARPRCPAAHSLAVKDHSYNHGAQRPARGGGARCPRAARQPTPALRPAHVCAAWPRHAPCMRPRSASPEARRACP